MSTFICSLLDKFQYLQKIGTSKVPMHLLWGETPFTCMGGCSHYLNQWVLEVSAHSLNLLQSMYTEIMCTGLKAHSMDVIMVAPINTIRKFQYLYLLSYDLISCVFFCFRRSTNYVTLVTAQHIVMATHMVLSRLRLVFTVKQSNFTILTFYFAYNVGWIGTTWYRFLEYDRENSREKQLRL